MIVKIDKTFEKDVKNINSQLINKNLIKILNEIQTANKISDISNLKKIQGTSNYYLIRIGDYRLGMIITKTEIQLIRLLHRKDIYKYFP
jgi:mRNA-degrading endonuclease RelE of RelBE toxin-antitoxin system